MKLSFITFIATVMLFVCSVSASDRVAESQCYFNGQFDKSKAFIVVSKLNETLSVYAPEGNDTILIARYPVCLSLNRGDKQRKGDMKTPESTMSKPFVITQIQDASNWRHDFKDGRGNILAYGKWFMRLRTPGHSGIGIHGSTNNEASVPGRASEGCIRLRDADIDHLKVNYAYVGMPVVVHAEDEANYPFEITALSKATATPMVINAKLVGLHQGATTATH